MRIKRFVMLLIVAFLSVAPLIAQEEEAVNPAIVCDEKYDACMDKCSNMSEGADQCYPACDTAYETCLTQAENAMPSTEE